MQHETLGITWFTGSLFRLASKLKFLTGTRNTGFGLDLQASASRPEFYIAWLRGRNSGLDLGLQTTFWHQARSIGLGLDLQALWPNGCKDQDETWRAGRPRPRTHCVRWGPSFPSPKGHSPQYSAHICCGQMPTWIKMSLAMEVGLSLIHI